MSKLPIITWTDEQIQDFLHTVRTFLVSDVEALTFHLVPSLLPTHPPTYLLELPNRLIRLTFDQASTIHYWLRIYFPSYPSSLPSEPVANPRDTQFLGFAKLLMDDLLAESEGYCLIWESEGNQAGMKRIRQQIAQRAYDFLVNSAYSSSFLDSWRTSVSRVSRVPDMTQWPQVPPPSS